jgi:hypothetical protein
MTHTDLHLTLAILAVVLAAAALTPSAAAVVLAFLTGLLAGHQIN